jgi:hypothetical protein
MLTRTSTRKKRHARRRSPEDLIVEKVGALANKPYVLCVENHFAGYFNELGFRIQVQDVISKEEILCLSNELLIELQAHFAEHALAFSWQVGIYKGEELIHVVAAGDEPLKFCPVCEDYSRLPLECCLICGSEYLS